MKKMLYALACTLCITPLVSQSALEPIIPNQNQDLLRMKEIAADLKNIATEIKKEYRQQLIAFKASTKPTVTPAVTSEMLKKIRILKDDTNEMRDLVEPAQLKEAADDIQSATLTIINAMQVIDGNLQTYFDMLPEDQGYKAIIDDTLKKLQNVENSLGKIAKTFRNPKATPFPPAEVSMIGSCASALMEIATTIRTTTRDIINLLTVKPKKSKNIFKRIFGT